MSHPVQLFRVLSDKTRLSIVMLLRESGELCVCDICIALGVSQPTISRSMALLREANLVNDRRDGRWVHYSLSPAMLSWAVAILDNALQALREETRERTHLMKLTQSSCLND